MMWKKCLRTLATTLATTLLVACSPKPATDNTIRIASKPMTEQFILAEMLGLLIEQHSGLKVSINGHWRRHVQYPPGLAQGRVRTTPQTHYARASPEG